MAMKAIGGHKNRYLFILLFESSFLSQEYLDSFVGKEDMEYLGEAEVARAIVELGYRSG